MAKREINLKCSDFLTNVFNSFNQLKSSDIFTDVTLVSDDNKQIQAHKIILSVGSEYFRNILSDKSHPHPMLCLDNVASEDLAWIIHYLYVGEVSVPQSRLNKFLKVANKLKCHGLNEDILSALSHKWGTGTLVSSESTSNEEIHQGTNMNKIQEISMNKIQETNMNKTEVKLEKNEISHQFDEDQAKDTDEVEAPLFISNDEYNNFPYQDNSEKKRRCAECIKEGARSRNLCPLATQCQKCAAAVCSCHKVTVCKSCLGKLISERNETDVTP